MKKVNFLKDSILQDISEHLCDALPKNITVLRDDLAKNFRAILEATFAKLDLVTREEFDTQTKVLARTREKLERLEALIKKLEQ